MAKPWLRHRGYLHLTPQLNVNQDRDKIHQYVTDPVKVGSHHFSPLLYKTITERRFKKTYSGGTAIRAHKWIDDKGEIILGAKKRPIHYATHIDAAIYAYYANRILGRAYEELLQDAPDLSQCITAYRVTPKGKKGRNNIHCAKEVFDLIKHYKNCVAVALDIKSFFSSLDHKLLKHTWCELLGRKSLPDDHFNVFRSVTDYSFVDLADLRVGNGGFDEYKLYKNRRKGAKAFFACKDDLFNEIKNGRLRIKKNQRLGKFKRKNKHTKRWESTRCGIPQGLAVSSVLANLYMLPFDRKMLAVADAINGAYRRYSDDLVFVCSRSDLEYVFQNVQLYIAERQLTISTEKTEICEFKDSGRSKMLFAKTLASTPPYSVQNERGKFTYLGFSYDGRKVLIKDRNIARYYRKMKQTVKRTVRRANHHKEAHLHDDVDIYLRRLRKAFKKRGSRPRKVAVYKRILQYDNHRKEYYLSKVVLNRKQYGNFHAYARRASKIMGEPTIIGQLRNSEKILERCIRKRKAEF